MYISTFTGHFTKKFVTKVEPKLYLGLDHLLPLPKKYRLDD